MAAHRSVIRRAIVALLLATPLLPAGTAHAAVPVGQGVMVVAHRGSSAQAAENTLAAVDQAVADHADRVGIDVHLTKDGVPVVLHDGTLARTTDAALVFPTRSPWSVTDFTLADIRRLDAGRWFPGGVSTGAKVPTLDEVLAELGGSPSGLVVEVKSPSLQGGADGIGRAVMQVLAGHPEWSVPQADGSPRLVLESFDWAFLDDMHAAYPDLPLALLGVPTADDMRAHPYAVEVDVFYGALDQSLVEAAHEQGMLVNTWTPNAESDQTAVVEAGVDAVTTDVPAQLRDLLAAQGKTWTGTTWPPPTAAAGVRLDGPAETLLGGTIPLRVEVVDADGGPVRWQPVRLQESSGAAWTDLAVVASDAGGVARAALPLRPPGTQLRAVSGDAASAPYVVPGARAQASRLGLLGPGTVVDGSRATLTVQWIAESGRPVDAGVSLYARTGTSDWSLAGSVTTQAGVARVTVRPRVTTSYEVRATSGSWYGAPGAALLRVRNVPPEPVVVPPTGAPRPAVRLAPQSRALAAGANARVVRVSAKVWSQMVGRSWRRGCPVGRAGLRTVRVGYWGFDGYAHRGELVVARRSATRLARVLTRLYDLRQPIRSLRRVESVGHYRTAVRRALRGDASFGFACQRLPGEETRFGSHARGSVVSVNPWENPARVGDRGVPDTWWLSRSRDLDYVHRSDSAVVRAFAARGFAWNGRRGKYAEFRDVR